MGVPTCKHQEIVPARGCYAANTAYEARYVQGLGVPHNRIAMVGVGVDLDRLSAAAAGNRELRTRADDHASCSSVR